MKKQILNLFAVGVTTVLMTACSTESVDEQMSSLNLSGEAEETVQIESEDLVGTWKVYSMTTNSQNPVDLDLNGTTSNDVLAESSCFDEMSFTFLENGTLSTNQAQLYFETATGAMECKTKVYEASYEIDGGTLIITFLFDGVQTSQTKSIALKSVEGQEFLELSLQFWEIQGYLPDNPQTPTGAADVENIDVVFVKQ